MPTIQYYNRGPIPNCFNCLSLSVQQGRRCVYVTVEWGEPTSCPAKINVYRFFRLIPKNVQVYTTSLSQQRYTVSVRRYIPSCPPFGGIAHFDGTDHSGGIAHFGCNAQVRGTDHSGGIAHFSGTAQFLHLSDSGLNPVKGIFLFSLFLLVKTVNFPILSGQKARDLTLDDVG